jgi:hypothetical protein
MPHLISLCYSILLREVYINYYQLMEQRKVEDQTL